MEDLIGFVVRGRGGGKTHAAVEWLRQDPDHRVIVTVDEQRAAEIRRQYGLTAAQVMPAGGELRDPQRLPGVAPHGAARAGNRRPGRVPRPRVRVPCGAGYGYRGLRARHGHPEPAGRCRLSAPKRVCDGCRLPLADCLCLGDEPGEPESGCDAAATFLPDGTCRCIVCSRCGHHTGNAHQGHYWAWCKVTHSVREFHRCCPDPAFGCELEAGLTVLRVRAEGGDDPGEPDPDLYQIES